MKLVVAGLITLLVGIGLFAVAPVEVSAANPLSSSCANAPAGDPVCASNNSGQQLFGANSFWTNIVNTMIFIVGTVSVLMIVVGGLRYVLSGGDSSATTSAKNTILYAIIGVVVALMAYAIINFVVIRLIPA